jgi:spore coat protein U-like protein
VSVDVDVFGRIPAMQSAPAGSYTDTVVVTLTY